MNKKRSSGFTLVELLVVIAIIALLLAILMPALGKARDQARMVVCQSNLKHFGLCYAMYVDQNNGYFEDGINWTATSMTMWMDVLRPYYADIDKARCCPSTSRPSNLAALSQMAAAGTASASYGTSRTCWTDVHGGQADYGSYAVNGWIINPKVYPGGWGDPANLWRSSNQKGSNNIPILADGLWFHSVPDSTDQVSLLGSSMTNPAWSMQRVCSDRHGGKTDVVFMDWTVRTVGLKQLWKLKWHRNFDMNALTPFWPRWIRKY